MSDDFDANTRAAADVSARLRALLLAHCADVPLDQLAAALAYELASVIATAAPTRADAIALVTLYASTQVDQIRALGVGRPHP